MLKFIRIFILTSILIQLVIACSKNRKPDRLQDVLNLASNNRVELEKVLSRYSREDSLKYQAACFLIENMPYYYYYEGEQLDNYLNYFRLLKENKKVDITPETLSDSIKKLYGTFSYKSLNVKYDLLTLDSAYICNNIDWAFKVWREQPWGKNVSFNDFCEYILPYRIRDEKPEYWREKFYNEYNNLLWDELKREPPEVTEDPIQAVFCLMRLITDKEDVYFTTVSPAQMPHVGPTVARLKSGNCGELTDYAVYVCRALGIPCHIDFMPVRGNDNVGHFWISYTDKYGDLYVQDFPEGVFPLLTNRIREDAKVKVYRHTFSCNLQMKKYLDELDSSFPEFFAQLMFIDVTYPYAKYYIGQMRIPVDRLYIRKTKAKIAYLCTAQHLNWMPVAWAPFGKDYIDFHDLQKGEIMRIAAWENNRLSYLSDPFRMDPYTNQIRYYSIQDSLQDIVIYSKFSVEEESEFRERMVGGVFEGSNDAGFSRKDTLAVISQVPSRLLIPLKSQVCNKKYRYVRYYGPNGGYCNVSEVAFYKKDSDTIPLYGKIIGTPGSLDPFHPHEYTNVFDGKTWTSFDYKEPSGGWAGLDLGKTEMVAKIVFSPRNRDNYIRTGDTFELFYLDKDWKSLGKATSKSDSLLYKNVPAFALLYLKNYSRGSQERIFTVENGKQIWH